MQPAKQHKGARNTMLTNAYVLMHQLSMPSDETVITHFLTAEPERALRVLLIGM